MSFGGDQYFDLNRAIDAIYGASGLLIQTGHWMSQVSYEVAGYSAIGNTKKNFLTKYTTSVLLNFTVFAIVKDIPCS
jgi:hypothetical protein